MEPLKRIPFEPDWALLRRPPGYPDYPAWSKDEMLWRTNSKSLYHRLSPYTSPEGILAWGKEPFRYVYPDENNGTIQYLRKHNFLGIGLGARIDDTIRVGKFMVSSGGVGFVLKQLLLQNQNKFPETRLYNPLSPNLAVTGIIRPRRHIDMGGGLLGGLVSAFTGGMFGNTKGAPKGTAAAALPSYSNYADKNADDGKGLIRGETATAGYGNLTQIWMGSNKRTSFGGFLKSLVRSLIPGTFPVNQPDGTKYRADENSYGLMVDGGSYKSGFSKFGYTGRNDFAFGFNQIWIGGNAGGMRRFDEKNKTAAKIYVNPDGTPNVKPLTGGTNVTGEVSYIPGVGGVGYTVAESTILAKPGIRYEDSIGLNSKDENKDYYAASDIMVNYSSYSVPKTEYKTKQVDPKVIEKTNEGLKKVINSLKKSGIYNVISPDESVILPSGNNNDPLTSGYNSIFKTKSSTGTMMPLNYRIGALAEYRDKNIRMVSNDLTTNVKDNSYKLPTAGAFDAINTLEVLDKDRKITNSKLKSWEIWEPYKDDLIALYFYDVVNQKYIPFRAAVKGIGESGNASWEELPFIGRADKVYSYGGFTRKLTMKLSIIISSIVELAPTWQRINYMTSLLKPANYTTAQYNNVMNRFMIPPMIMLTLGDMYKDQPILIESISTTIPEDAAWETQHQFNMEDWKYLVDYIKAPTNALYGQLPREVDMDFSMIILEKERAVAGGANFGHAPRNTNWNFVSDNKRSVLDEFLVIDNLWSNDFNNEDTSLNRPNVNPPPPIQNAIE